MLSKVVGSVAKSLISNFGELSKVVRSIASSLLSDSGHGAFDFMSPLAFRPSAKPHSKLVDQHVEEYCSVFSVGSTSWFVCVVESCNVEVVQT